VQSAVDAASHGDLIQVEYTGDVYDEQVTIDWPGTASAFTLRLEGVAGPQGQLPEITWDEDVASDFVHQVAVVEIRNEVPWPGSDRDMHVTIDGLRITGTCSGSSSCYSPGAIAVWTLPDVGQLAYTRIDIKNNVLDAEHAQNAALAIGLRTPENLYDQSVTWGDVVNNVIRNGNPDIGDAISAHHFLEYTSIP
jgi:hypothetical protein